MCSSRFLPPDFHSNLTLRRDIFRHIARLAWGREGNARERNCGDGDIHGSLVVFPCKILPLLAKE
jgi:hypothetical protein